jgi:hypothetical protein
MTKHEMASTLAEDEKDREALARRMRDAIVWAMEGCRAVIPVGTRHWTALARRRPP